MKWNLKLRIVTPTILLVSAITVTIAVVAYTMSRNALSSTLDKQLQDLSNATVSSVEDWITAQSLMVQQWAGDSTTVAAVAGVPDARAKLSADYARTRTLLGYMEGISLTDASGLIVAGSDPATVGKINIGSREYFKQAMGGKVAISEVVLSQQSGNPIVVVAAPIMDGNTAKGVVFAAVDLKEFSKREIGTIKILESGYAFMFDRSGLILAHPKTELIMKTKVSEFDWGKQVMATRDGKMLYTYDGTQKTLVYRTSKSLGWGIAIDVSQSELDAPSRRMASIIAIIGLVAFVIGLGVSIFTARAIAKPLTAVAAQLTANSEQTAAAAHQVSSASTQLATGATQQAVQAAGRRARSAPPPGPTPRRRRGPASTARRFHPLADPLLA